MHRWTPEQELAINTRGGDLLVSAAAGTGKTAVLVDRAIRLITADGVDCDRLLVVTFTNAAAAEMKNRLRQALSEQISLNPSASRLRSQLAILDRAFIGTIHSFCLNLIKQHFYLAELDPRFRVASEEETALLRAAAVEELFERRYDEGAAGFAALLDCYGGERGWRALQELVLTLYTYAQNSPDPQGWLRAAAGRFFLPGDAALEAQPWFADLKKHIALTLQAARELLREGIALAARTDGPAAYLDVFRADLALLEHLASSCAGTWEEMTGAFARAEFPRLKALRRDTGEDLKEQAKNCREAAKRKISGLREELFSRSASQYLDELRKCAPLLQELVALALDFSEIYRQVKNSHGAVDFSDLEHLALKILTAPGAGPSHLTPSEVARQLQNYFAEILVDEYQDINPVQEAILSLVARNNLFMVGDAKQSIYRFRLTEPGIFLAKYQSYAPVGKPSRQRKVSLVRNFRCRENLVGAVNLLFRRIMTPGVGELAYEELVYGASYPPLPGAGHAADHLAELHLLEKSALENENGAKRSPPDGEPAGEESEADGLFDPEGPEELAAAQREARLIARQIIELVHGDPPLLVWDAEARACRPATYRDVVVLMRSAINDAPVFLEEFTRMGVPAWTDAGAGYFAATEIETMLSLLKIIANPRQDIPLAGVLRSPLVGLTLDELARIRLCRPAGDFYDAVLAAASGTEGEEQEQGDGGGSRPGGTGVTGGKAGPDRPAAKLQAFLGRLERWRTISRQKPLALLIWDIYRQTGYYDFVGGLPGGRERQANLRALFNR
ncbi:MAG: helicase-exonuclease AddAB subunit AddA, partial [Bacillota bacterium]